MRTGIEVGDVDRHNIALGDFQDRATFGAAIKEHHTKDEHAVDHLGIDSFDREIENAARCLSGSH